VSIPTTCHVKVKADSEDLIANELIKDLEMFTGQQTKLSLSRCDNSYLPTSQVERPLWY